MASVWELGCSDIGDGYQSFGEELFDPDFAYIQQPRLLAAGDFSNLQMELDEQGNRFVVAINDDTDELTIVPLDGGETCVAGAVDDYAGSIGDDLGETILLPFVTPDDELRFTDLRCNLSEAVVPDSPLTRSMLDDAGPEGGPGVVVFTHDERIVFANPWTGDLHEIATGVTRAQSRASRFWSVEDGQLVVRDQSLETLASFGNDVRDYVITTSQPREVAFLEPPPDAQADSMARVLKTLDFEFIDPEVDDEQRTDAIEQHAEDVCQVDYLTSGGDTYLAYLAPCADGDLWLDHRNADVAELIDTDVTRPPRLHQQSGELRISYIKHANPGSSVGELWSRLGDDEPVLVADGGKLDLLATSGDGLRVVADWDGSTGTLLHWEDGDSTEILGGVVEVNSLGVLADYDGKVGSLYLLDDLEPTFIADGVPRGGRRDNAFLINYEGVTGDLVLLDEATLELTHVGTGVGKDGFGFAVQFNAMVYLAERDPDDGTSTLKLTFFDTGDVFAISSGVTESREVAIPKPGILYAIGQDERAGIWFAEAR